MHRRPPNAGAAICGVEPAGSACFRRGMDLAAIGWDEAWQRAFEPHAAAGLEPARVTVEFKHEYDIHTATGPRPARCTGRLLGVAAARVDLPAVGDWVAVSGRPGELMADIRAVLPRHSRFVRRAAGPHDEAQVVAANVDVVFLVSGLDADYSLRRIERYLTVAWASGAEPVVVLNKSDLRHNLTAVRAEVAAVAAGAPVVLTSALAARGLRNLRPWLRPGRTVAFLGSSGVGKSSLVNRLLGEETQTTQGVSGAEARGRHTTAARELLIAPSGVLVIDTPGMRELQLWDGATGLDATFPEIAALAAQCRFRDCHHGSEPGCAVKAALADGSLDAARWRSYCKLRTEQASAHARHEGTAVRRGRKRIYVAPPPPPDEPPA